jgi:hypothetical protein
MIELTSRIIEWPFLMLRVLWSHDNDDVRLRLSRPDFDLDQVRARMVRFIERAKTMGYPIKLQVCRKLLDGHDRGFNCVFHCLLL